MQLHAGAPVFKPVDSSQKWTALPQWAKIILESLLHHLPERRLTPHELLRNPWLYLAQGKPYPFTPITTPYVPSKAYRCQ